MEPQIQATTERVRDAARFVHPLRRAVEEVIVGQSSMIDALLIGLLTRGHVLLEGVPGLAKTLAIRTLASAIHTRFKRIQFTPDLLPSDLVGTMVFDPARGVFEPRHGPIFANLILADEVNRAPAKVQSALLEAMEERQVTIGETSWSLEDPFLVLATQNPIEQEGTYPLPEAQVDRFMLKVQLGYPRRDEERRILDRMVDGEPPAVEPVLEVSELFAAREAVKSIYVDERIKEYVVDLVQATRDPRAAGLGQADAELIRYGASPRATLYLLRAARAHAFLDGRGFVTPEDVKAVGLEVLRHRVILSFEADAEEVTSDDLVRKVFDVVEVPLITRELLRKARRIEMITSRRADESFAGAYRSVFRGRGVEFDEVREYAWGDDVRAIDWNVTARTGVPHVKRYQEERELTVFLAVDVSGSLVYGSGASLKAELAAEVAAVLAFSAIKNRDRVGALLFDERPGKVLRPGHGPEHVMRVVQGILAHTAATRGGDGDGPAADLARRGTDVPAALRYVGRVLTRRSIVFLVSDLLGPGLGEAELAPALASVATRHDLIAVRVRDPAELRLPDAGLARLEDPETGVTRVVDLGSSAVRADYAERLAEHDAAVERVLRRAGVDLVRLVAGEPYHRPLARFFRARALGTAR